MKHFISFAVPPQKMNTTDVPGNTTSCQTTMPRITTQVGLTGAYVIVFVGAIFGNSLVLHVLRSQKNMRTAFNYLIANMAIADILDALFAVPYLIHSLFHGSKWFPGTFALVLCKMVNYFGNVSIAVSVLTMTIITVDRYFAVVHVLKKSLSLRTVKRLIIMVWIVSGVVYIIEIYKFNVKVYPGGHAVCFPDIGSNDWDTVMTYFRVETLVKFIITYVIPFTVMAVLYTIIIAHLWKRKHIGEANSASYRRLQAQKKSVVIKLVTVVVIFAVCWIPVHMIHFLYSFDLPTWRCLPTALPLVFYWLAHANTAINPCIYLMLTKHSRKMIRESLGGTDNKLKTGASGSIPPKQGSRLTLKTQLKKKEEINDVFPLCGSQTDTAL